MFANFWFQFHEICVPNQWAHKRSFLVWVQLLFGWNTYLFSNSNTVDFVWKADEGEVEGIVLLIFVSFSWNFSQSNKHDTFWHIVLTGFFYLLFLRAIVVSDFFLSLENLLKLRPSLAYYHFYSQQLIPVKWKWHFTFSQKVVF